MNPPPGCVRGGGRTRFADFESYLGAQLKQSPRARSETEARVELLISIMIWKRNPGKREKKRALKGSF